MWNPFTDAWPSGDYYLWLIDFQSWSGINMQTFVEFCLIFITCLILSIATLLQFGGSGGVETAPGSALENASISNNSVRSIDNESLSTVGGRRLHKRRRR
jgi:hypothetical protein